MVSFDVIIIDPYGDIDRAISSKKWVAGFTFACTYLEHFGAIKIRNKLENQIISKIEDSFKKKARNNLYDKVKRMRVRDIIFQLLTFNVIDIETYLDLDAVIKFRNNLVHPARKGIGYQHALEQSKAKRLLLIAKKRILQIQETKI